MLVWNLARHAISEELTAYPAMVKHPGAEGEALIKDNFEQHQAQEDMPRLEATISKEEYEVIARRFARTKELVPTKSHPDAPTSHWIIKGLAGLLATPIDKLRTMMEEFQEGEKMGSTVEG
ncbi:hypothetical protein B0J14DRAFT_651753 [Halenospora varia]|nr:hypothetical protein B0J14DRAFT_651753 [Halenospora varia]